MKTKAKCPTTNKKKPQRNRRNKTSQGKVGKAKKG